MHTMGWKCGRNARSAKDGPQRHAVLLDAVLVDEPGAEQPIDSGGEIDGGGQRPRRVDALFVEFEKEQTRRSGRVTVLVPERGACDRGPDEEIGHRADGAVAALDPRPFGRSVAEIVAGRRRHRVAGRTSPQRRAGGGHGHDLAVGRETSDDRTPNAGLGGERVAQDGGRPAQRHLPAGGLKGQREERTLTVVGGQRVGPGVPGS